ncbi:unnamed protein product [Rhizophagus irregularis]|nr:unnamed protein product [Rhizophagus irregularis]
MQAESSKNSSTFPSLEYFLPDNEYDSDDFNFLGYDLVEKLDEINTEQNEVIINEKMRKDNDAIVDDKKDDIIIEGEDDVIVDDDVMVEDIEDVEDVEDNVIVDDIDINLQKRKRKRSKKIILQTDIDKLRNKLHANKYFMEEIIPELVCCKCGKEIRLDRKFRDKNLTTHGELSNCNPAEFGGSIRPDIAAKELFPEIVKANLRLKSLGKMRCADLKNYLRAHAIWILDKTTLSVRSKTCENFTTRESSICDECDKLRKNSRLNQATKKVSTGKNIRFIPKWYLEHPLSKLLLNTNLKSLWVSADNSDSDAEIWFKLAQFGKDGLFKGEKTFQELASLMIQIQEKKLQDKKMTGLRYSKYLKQFFCLLSDSSREYEIFRQMFAGMSIRSIRYM